jgi:SAM-dependent methyltransferase
MDRAAVEKRAKELAPWHFDFELFEGFRTASCNLGDRNRDTPPPSAVDPLRMGPVFRRHYPRGLAGKEVLDVACNSGGYCFVAGELGARRARGFDIRQHWIDQAQFVHAVRYPHLDNVFFELGDAKEIKKFGEADVVLFKGIFYHLPDPVQTLSEACAAAHEMILVDTATDETVPEGCMSVRDESRTALMSGVDGVARYPGGPAALVPIFASAGFPYVDVVFWRHNTGRGFGRMRLVAHRSEATRGTKPAPPIGYVSRFQPPDRLSGWARRQGHPDPLMIQIFADGELIGSATADRQHRARPENCWFEVRLSRPIAAADLAAGSVVAHAVDEEGNSMPLQVSNRLAGSDKERPAR